MLASLPGETADFLAWSWADVEPHFRDLQLRSLSTSSIDRWLADWSWVAERLDEIQRRLEVATTRNTTDEAAQERFHDFLDELAPRWKEAEQRLKQRLLESGLEPGGFDMQLRKMRTEAALYREANLRLQSEEQKLAEAYQQVRGAQTVTWKGEEIPTMLLRPVFGEQDRGAREEAWRLVARRQLEDRDAVHSIWRRGLEVRQQMAANAGEPEYRAYRWKELKRFDYTPEDCLRFHRAVEERVVPALRAATERRRRRLGVDTLRPWDLEVDPLGRPPLRPYRTVEELEAGVSSIFHRVDPELGRRFDSMISEGLLDLDTRKNKAQSGYCLPFNASRIPFIFLNTTSTHGDVVGMLHEGGHAFHVFEMSDLPYVQQRDIESLGAEFGEVGSMAMEYLARPYLARDEGGFYSRQEAARARIESLEWSLFGWSHIAVIDAFQHWAYRSPEEAADAGACAAAYAHLVKRYLPDIDYTGLEAELGAGWQQIPHIFESPFYYIEYGLAELGAAQIWEAALEDQAAAVKRYRHALSLGDTLPIPRLFEEAGAKLAFDGGTLGRSVDLMVASGERLESEIAP